MIYFDNKLCLYHTATNSEAVSTVHQLPILVEYEPVFLQCCFRW